MPDLRGLRAGSPSGSSGMPSSTGEESTNAAGLLRWPAKLMFPLGFALLLLQAVSELIKRIEALLGLTGLRHQSYEKPVQ